MPKSEIVETDILIVGGGVAGLATAIHLADLATAAAPKEEGAKLPWNILVLEKGSSIGSHTLSGAVIDPSTLKELLPGVDSKDFPFESPVKKEGVYFLTPELALKAPFTPPFMGNHGNFVVSLGKMTRWLAEIAEKKVCKSIRGSAFPKCFMKTVVSLVRRRSIPVWISTRIRWIISRRVMRPAPRSRS